MNQQIRIIFVEDVATDAELAVRELTRGGYDVVSRRVETSNSLLHELETFAPQLILSDFSLPTFDGLAALAIARQHDPDLPFMFLSGTIGEQIAIDALKGGASDYLFKTNMVRLVPAVRRVLDEVGQRAARRRAEALFRGLIECAPDAMVVVNEQGAIALVNEQVELMFGYGRDEIVGKPGHTLIPARFDAWHDKMAHTAATLPPPLSMHTAKFEVAGLRKNGVEFPVEIGFSYLQTDTGLWKSSVIRDISQRRAQAERLARLSRIYNVRSRVNTGIVQIPERQAFLDDVVRIAVRQGQFAGAMISMLDGATGILEPVAWAEVGTDGVIGKTLPYVRASIDQDAAEGQGSGGSAMRTRRCALSNDLVADTRVAAWRSFYRAKGYQAEFVVPLLVGAEALGVVSFYAAEQDVFDDEEQWLLQKIGEDVSFALGNFARGERLDYLSSFDPVTNLTNRSLFETRLAQVIEDRSGVQDRQFALFVLDVEQLRNVSETLGRATGDQLLRVMAHRLQHGVPASSLLAKINDECFACIVTDRRDVADVVALLDSKQTGSLSAAVRLADREIHVSLRSGIALFPLDGTDVETLLRNAEAALETARTCKVRSLHYHAGMNARAIERLSLENRLRRALDDDQFILHYQTKIDLPSGRLVGLEALLRWNDPSHGLVPPSAFIPILEDTGLIVEVGRWVIARAYRQHQAWAAMGLEAPRIAVNVSPLQIRQDGFVRGVTELLGPDGPDKIEIEITESLLIEDLESNIAKLAALRLIGFTVAIDDFGTGYSSLSNLVRLPVDTLKIDRSFVTLMTTSADHMAIVSTIISLAHSLNLTVVAEGVETEQQAYLLKMLRCDLGQGFLYSRPLPAADIEGALRRAGPAPDQAPLNAAGRS